MKDIYVLVTWKVNWADEADFAGFKVCLNKEWLEYTESLKAKFERNGFIEWDFGTNEENEYTNKKEFEKLLNEFQVQYISEEEFNTLIKLFGKDFGIPLPNVEESNSIKEFIDEYYKDSEITKNNYKQEKIKYEDFFK